ncbi:MAG: tetratricopeptide repeat protein [Terriglobales bacterium]
MNVSTAPENILDPPATKIISASAGSRPRTFSPRWLLALAFGLTLVTYLQVWRFDFVYDDHLQIENNPKIRAWNHVGGYFTSHLWANVGNFDRSSNYYRPLFLVWLRLNHALFGLRASFWHATSLALHLLVVWLVYRAALRLLELMAWEEALRQTTAALTALIFALHPVHIEPVVWISASSELLLTIFFLLAFTAYAHSRLRAGPRRRLAVAASLACFCLALMAKETALMLAPVLLGCEVMLERTEGRGSTRWRSLTRAAAAIVPWVAVAAGYLIVRHAVLGEFGHTQVPLGNDVVLKTLPALLWFYARHLLWPYPLAVLYDVFYVDSVHSRQFLVPLLAMLPLAAALWAVCRGSRAAKVAALWMGVTLLPVLDVSLLRFNTLAQDRYLYLPSFGFCLLVALALGRLCAAPRLARVALYAVLALTTAAGVLAAREAAPWENDFLLFGHAVAVSPRNAMAKTSLASELLLRGENDRALQLLRESYAIDSYAWTTSFNLGYLYFTAGDLPHAEQFFQRAIWLDPHNRNQFLLLGLTQKRSAHFADAAVTLAKTAEIWPEAPLVHLSLGEVLEQQGRYDEARRQYEQELNGQRPEAARAALARLARHP